MPDLASMLLKQSLGALSGSEARCADCERTPLAGESLYELESGKLLCELCFARLPEERRVAVSSRRVPAGERALAVVPKAA